MREALLNILKCIICKKDSFTMKISGADQLEIRSGAIICKGCNTSYPIKDGIVDFLENANTYVLRERRAMDEDAYITDENGNKYRVTNETIQRFRNKFLSLPEGDGSFFFKKGGSFQSIAEGSSRFYSTLNDLHLTGREKILEIGACFSYASFKFAKLGCSVVAIDISNYLKVADLFVKEAYFDRLFSDMHDTPFLDNTFDIVFGSAVLHHSKNLKKVFNEIYRVLKPKGRLILINESARGIFERIHPVFEEMAERGFQDTSYTIPQWKRGAEVGGFKKVRIELLSLTDDYIARHKNRGSGDSIKLKVANFFNRHRFFESCLLSLLVLPRILFRPKSWRMVCYK